MNGYEYRQNSAAFDTRLQNEIYKVQAKYANGKIKTQTDYAYELKEAILNFYNNLGKPSMKFIAASTVPYYTEYRKMISDSITDMNTVIKGSDANYKALETAQDKAKENINVLSNRLEGIENTVEHLQNKITAIRKASDTIFSDDFTTYTSKNINSSSDIAAYIDVSTGTLMLGISNNKSTSESNLDIEILDTSNGFPGNTHEVYDSIGTINNNINFKGADNSHLKLSAIKTVHATNNRKKYTNEDWFEFEMYNIQDSLKESTGMIGFNYKENISWVTDDDTLKLDLKLTLKEECCSNYIILKGSPKSNENVSNPIIKTITISDSDAILQKINVGKELVGTVVIPFGSQNVKYVTINLVQSEKVSTKVCRQYALNIDPTKVSKYISNDYKHFIQLDNPVQSIELLGLKYNKKDKTIIYPSTTDTETFLTDSYTKSQLFYNTIAENGKEIIREVVNADRYCIGIGEVDIRYRKYVETGTYISKTFTPGSKIKQLVLNSEDYIPNKYEKYLKEGQTINDFIKYYISFDNGNEWIEIYPRHKASSGSCTIIINSDAAVLNRNKNVTYYDSLVEPDTFKIKIELSRPSEIVDETPIVYSYNVDVSSREDF